VGLWRNIRRGWGIFLAILDLWWVMDLKLSFDMMYGAGTKP